MEANTVKDIAIKDWEDENFDWVDDINIEWIEDDNPYLEED